MKILTCPNVQANNNQFYKETISSINKKYSSRELSPIQIIRKKTEEEYDEMEVKKHQQNFLGSLSSKNKSHKVIDFHKSNSVLNRSLDHYKSKDVTDEEMKPKKNTKQNLKKKYLQKKID